MIDNHMIHDEDKILSKGDKCSCGGSWTEIDWCEQDRCPCEQGCGANLEDKDCPMIETRLLCRRCGVIVKEEE